jgi:hypothetical protein
MLLRQNNISDIPFKSSSRGRSTEKCWRHICTTIFLHIEMATELTYASMKQHNLPPMEQLQDIMNLGITFIRYKLQVMCGVQIRRS